MEKKSTGIDFSFVKIFEYLLYSNPVLLLIYGVLLFDTLEIIVYGKGILETDFSIFFNPSVIPFLLLFLSAFGVVASGLSSLTIVAVFKLFNCFSSKFYSFLDKLLKFESKPERGKNLQNISSLYEIALITENSFLLEYLNKEVKYIHSMKKFHRIIYSLSIAAIINLFITLLYGKNTIINFIYGIYKYNENIFIKICLSLLLMPVVFTILYGLKHSVIFDGHNIYFPKAKYELLEKELLLNKKLN